MAKRYDSAAAPHELASAAERTGDEELAFFEQVIGADRARAGLEPLERRSELPLLKEAAGGAERLDAGIRVCVRHSIRERVG